MGLVKQIQKIADENELFIFPDDVEGVTLSIRVVKNGQTVKLDITARTPEAAKKKLIKELKATAKTIGRD